MTAADHESLRSEPTPLEALKHAVRGSFERVRYLPTGQARWFGEPGFDRSESGGSDAQGAFDMLSRHVRAAQRAGEIKAGDASLMTALIIGSVLGAADLARYARARPCVSESDFLPLLLLELLTTKGYN